MPPMNRFLTVLVMGFVAALVLAGDSTRAEFVRTYAQIEKMFTSRNMDAFEKLLAKDFVYVGTDHKPMNRVAFILAECDPIRSATKVLTKVKVTSVKTVGQDVRVGYDWRYSIFEKRSKTVGREVGTDTWRKIDGEWLTVRTDVSKASERQFKR